MRISNRRAAQAWATLFLWSVMSGGAVYGLSIDTVDLWPGPHSADPFEMVNGVTVSSHSTLVSGSRVDDMFGARLSTVEATNTLFQTATENQVTFRTQSAIDLVGYQLWLNEDPYRRIDRYRIYAGLTATTLALLADVDLMSPFESYYGSPWSAVRITDTFSGRRVQYFKLVVWSAPGTRFGARINEIDAIVAEPVVVPTPAAAASGVVLFAALALGGDMHRARARRRS